MRQRVRRLSWWSRAPLAALSVGALAVAGAAVLPQDPSAGPGARVLGETLTASTCGGSGTFSVCGPAAGSGPVLYPGVSTPNNLGLIFGNPLAADIYVNSITVYFTNSFVSTSQYPGTCDATALQVNGMAVAFPAHPTSGLGADPYVTVALPSVPVTAGHTTAYSVTLALAENHQNQDDCQSLPLSMTYSATAQYTDATAVALSSALNPATLGSSTKLTATVSAADASFDTTSSDGASPPPDGTASFYRCPTSSACVTVVGGSITVAGGTTTLASGVALSSGSASYTTSAYLTAGSYYYQAAYQPSAAHSSDYAVSASPVLTETVSPCTTTISTSTPGNQTVMSGQVLCITGTGTVGGNVTVNSNGTLDLAGGKVGGNVQSSGVLSVTSGSSVGGNLQTSGGGPVNIAGTSVGGNLQLQSQTVGPDSICGTSVKGNLQVQSNAGTIQIGGSSTCVGNTVGGNLQLQSNSGKLTIGGTSYGNSVGGNLQVQSNTGGGTLVGNSASKNCQLQGDTSPITGSGNYVNGSLQSSGAPNSCNRTA